MEENIRFETLKEHEYKEVLEFMIEHFLPDEPSFNGMGCEVDDFCKNYMVERLKTVLTSHLSFKAIDTRTSQVLGMKLCYKHDIQGKGGHPPYQIEGVPENAVANAKKLSQFVRFYNDIFKVQDYRDKIIANDDCILKSMTLSTSKNSRGKGVGTRLVKEMINRAADQNFKSIGVTVSSAFSRKFYKKLGFEILHEEMYKDFEMDGERIFVNDTGIHKGAAFCVKNM